MYHGDIRLGDTIDIKFSTFDVTGTPITLAGSPVISAYIGNDTTQLTAGITLSVDFDGVTGLHNVRVVASGANGYAAATNVVLVITTGTVDGISAVGTVVGAFSIQNRSNLSAAEVNAEVVDALNVDTYAQPGQATPAATTTIRLMLAYLYKAWRNKSTQDATDYKLFNDDASTVDQKAGVTDAAGTTTRGEVATGP